MFPDSKQFLNIALTLVFDIVNLNKPYPIYSGWCLFQNKLLLKTDECVKDIHDVLYVTSKKIITKPLYSGITKTFDRRASAYCHALSG